MSCLSYVTGYPTIIIYRELQKIIDRDVIYRIKHELSMLVF